MPEPTAGPIVTVDRDLCMGSGMCVMYAPATFVHDDEAKAVVLEPHGDPVDQILIAVEACPMGAIHIRGDEQGE